MEHCDGEICAMGPELSDGGGSVDRLSALPDDILIHILVKLHGADIAARTSILSGRWRRLWTLLPELRFSSSDSLSIRSALESHEAPVIHCLKVITTDTTPESMQVWLRIAARRLSGGLLLINTEEQDASDDEATEKDALELPCFKNATSILIILEPHVFFCLTLPPSGVFTRLTQICLAHIELHGPTMLGDVVSSPRCPALRSLAVRDVRGQDNFAVNSDSLLEIKLERMHDLHKLTVMARALKVLNVDSCFADHSGYNQPVANISAPLLVSLSWMDAYDPRFTHFGEMENLESLETKGFLVFGRVGSNHRLWNSYSTEILRCWRPIQNLSITLFFTKDITNCEYLMEDITKFPNIRNLALDISANGHSCGASLYHILRMCTGVKEMDLRLGTTLLGSLEAQTVCPSGCVCDQPANWKTDEFVLKSLRKIRIHISGGTENEDGLVKRLFDWATVLQTMTVTFGYFVAESKAKEFSQMLQSFSKPGVCLIGPHFP